MQKIIKSFKFAEVTGFLILINLVIFIITLMVVQPMYDMFAMHHPSTGLFAPGQIITHMFMHGGFLHLLFNMFVLWQFGRGMEKLWGHTKFIIFYIVCGLGSVLLHTTLMTGDLTIPMVGASGAIYGLVVGFVAMYPEQRMSIIFLPWWDFKASKFIMVALGIELVLAISGLPTGIGHWAHLGGALTGFLLFVFWLKGRKIKQVEKFIPQKEDYIESKSVAHRILGYEKDIAYDKEAYVKTFFNKITLIGVSVFTKAGNMVWQGDLDMRESEDKIKEIAKELKTTVYITKDVAYKRDYIYKTNGSSSDYQDLILNKYRNKVYK